MSVCKSCEHKKDCCLYQEKNKTVCSEYLEIKVNNI